MAGVLGFEPRNAGIKTLCLTTWRHPKKLIIYHNANRMPFCNHSLVLSSIFVVEHSKLRAKFTLESLLPLMVEGARRADEGRLISVGEHNSILVRKDRIALKYPA